MYNRWFPYWPDWHVMKSFVSRRFPEMERPFMVGVPTASDWTEALLRSVTDSAPLGFFVVDNRTDAILYFNELFCEIWNIQRLEGRLRRGELKNSDIIPDCLPLVKDVPAFVESCKPLQSEENRTVVEDEVGFVDRRTVRRVSTQIRDVDDRYFGRLYVFEDITARKRAEQALVAAHRQLETRVKERTKALEETNSALEKEVAERRLAEEALRRSEEQLRALFDNSPDFTLTLDQEGAIRYINRTREDLTTEQVIGSSCYEYMQGAYIDGFRRALDSVFQQGKSSQLEFATLKGTLFSVRLVPLKKDDRVAFAMAIATDITERKRAEEERQKLEEKIQHAQKLESLGVLAGGIAHDFNNLLTSVMGNAELALREMPPGDPSRSYLNDIATAAEHAAQLTRQMLAYAGKGRFAVESLDLSRLVGEMAHLVEVSISKKVVFRYDLAETLASVKADPTQLRQLVMNLITNAGEAIGDGSGSVAIRTGVMEADRNYLSGTYLDEELPEGDYAYLEVADTGCGMDHATLERIFDPFFTTKFAGRGLGLAAALGIVRGHKGAVKIDSQPGRGTTFRVLFPASPKVIEDDPRPPVRTGERWRGSGVILVVDDEESVRTFVTRLLQKHGFRVVTANDGREAVEVFQSRDEEIAAVVLDLTMPRMDGEEAFRELRRLSSGVKVILTSGYSEREVTHRFAGKELAGFAQKPFRPGDLVSIVRQVLEGGRSASA